MNDLSSPSAPVSRRNKLLCCSKLQVDTPPGVITSGTHEMPWTSAKSPCLSSMAWKDMRYTGSGVSRGKVVGGSRFETVVSRRRRRVVATAARGLGLALFCCANLLWNTRVDHDGPSDSFDPQYNGRFGIQPFHGRALAQLDGESAAYVPLSDVVAEEEEDKCGSIINKQADRCAYVREHCLEDGEGVVNFTYFHNCTMHGRFGLSLLCLLLIVLLLFYLLGETAEEYFCPVVKKLTVVLDLAPNTAGVTFLAFGNGAPDVFSSLAAFLEGDGKIGIGAIVSGGSFVSAFVVGAVAICAGPFAVYNGYIRDICFYFAATLMVFWIFRSGHIHLWQAMMLVGYYCAFVVYVVWVDSIKPSSADGSGSSAADGPSSVSTPEKGLDRGDTQPHPKDVSSSSSSTARILSSPSMRTAGYVAPEGATALTIPGNFAWDDKESPKHMSSLTILGAINMYTRNWCAVLMDLPFFERVVTIAMQPITLLRWATVPDATSYNRLQAACNTLLCPLLLLLFFNDFVDFGMPVAVLGAGNVPLWSVVLFVSSLLTVAQWRVSDWRAPPHWLDHTLLFLAFVCSIAWISMLAQELLSCLSTLGHIMGLSPAIMGVTVLAWGNSIGDLVADVALARAGEPVVALAGCIAGPLFNMLIGLGLSLVIKTALMFPQPYGLHYNPNIPVSFGFLFVTLMSCTIAVPCSNYRITKQWGYCLVAIYFSAMVTSLLVESEVLNLR